MHAELVQLLDDKSLSLMMRDARMMEKAQLRYYVIISWVSYSKIQIGIAL